MEGETNSRKARSSFSRYGNGLVNPSSREIGLNEHLISVNLRIDV